VPVVTAGTMAFLPDLSMLCLLGPSALSSFRADNLIERLRAVDVPVTELAVEPVYLAELDESAAWSEGDQAILNELVDASLIDVSELAGHLLIVPRIGTVSPWSSKATDICHATGLSSLIRVEHGRKISLPRFSCCTIGWSRACSPM